MEKHLQNHHTLPYKVTNIRIKLDRMKGSAGPTIVPVLEHIRWDTLGFCQINVFFLRAELKE